MKMNLNLTSICCIVLFAHLVFVSSESSLRKKKSIAEEEDVTASVKSSGKRTGGVLTYPLLPHHVVHERRRRELGEESIGTEEELGELARGHPLGTLYQGYGTHYVDLWVGSPKPERQTVIVDTGSSITAFPCEGCQDCGQGHHIDLFYPFSKSESFEPLACGQCTSGYCGSLRTNLPVGDKKRCKLSMSYQEGSSWDAFESQDIVYFGGPHNEFLPGRHMQEETQQNKTEEIEPKEDDSSSDMDKMFQNDQISTHAREYSFPLKFGCQYSITGLFKTQLADGIMGMEDNPNSFWRQMHAAKVIQDAQFALCFTKADRAKKSGTLAGAITLGGTNTKLHKSPMVFAQNTKNEGWYTINIRAIYLSSNTEDKRIRLDVDYNRLNSNGIIIDSGTTDSYLPTILKQPFKDAFNELSEISYKNGMLDIPKETVEKLPSILIQLKGAENVEGEIKNEDGSPVKGLAAELDPVHPNDVIMEVHPLHYFEYLRSREKYESRFHLTEDSGGVLGANIMAGHDILFDADNHRIGIAQSDCDYAKLSTESAS